jgi:murein L,D-transpeptidase YcbB/YkuD
MADPRLAALARRLEATGDLRPEDGVPDMARYGGATETAVRRFQARHGLTADGAVGAGTLAALNLPVTERIRQIVLNLERRRWTPRNLGERYLFVNLADFTVRVVDGETVLAKARLVVGKPFSRTPVFSARMTYVEINPTWNVPHQIAVKELLPKARKDPSYLARNHYTLLSGWSADAVRVDPAAVDWHRLGPGRFPYAIRQEPGDDNALGRIKFMFPNRFDVYLHDTPAKALFARTVRAFSHGCMRVQNALDLAPMIFAMAGNDDWTAERIAATVATGTRTVVPLKRPLSVHVSYATAFVSRDGELQFRPDVYGRDARLAAALFDRAPRSVTISAQ